MSTYCVLHMYIPCITPYQLTLSTGTGATFSPPLVISISSIRPVMVRKPEQIVCVQYSHYNCTCLVYCLHGSYTIQTHKVLAEA